MQGEGSAGSNQGRSDLRRVGERVFGVHPNHIYNRKKQLLDGVASVFEDGASAEGAVNEAQVDVLYRQIGQLKVENDFRTKARQLSRAERRAMVERVNPVSDFCVAALELFGRHGSYQKDMAAAGERLRSKRDRRRSRDCSAL